MSPKLNSFEKRVRELDEELKGDIGVCVEQHGSGDQWSLRGDEMFPTASSIKTSILAVLGHYAKKKEVDLKEKIAAPKSVMVGGSGVITDLSPGAEYAVEDLAILMIVISDNTATNMIIDHLGIDAINKQLDEWGMEKTVLHRKVNFKRKPSDPPLFAESTPNEMTTLLARIGRRKLLGKKWDGWAEDVLRRQKLRDALPRYLPDSGSWSGKDRAFTVAHKTGSIDGCRIDAGIITSPAGRYSISVFTKNLKDNRYHADNEGVLAIGKVSRAAYDFLLRRKRSEK